MGPGPQIGGNHSRYPWRRDNFYLFYDVFMREIGCTTVKIRLRGSIDDCGSCCGAEMEVLARPVRSEVSSDSFGRRSAEGSSSSQIIIDRNPR